MSDFPVLVSASALREMRAALAKLSPASWGDLSLSVAGLAGGGFLSLFLAKAPFAIDSAAEWALLGLSALFLIAYWKANRLAGGEINAIVHKVPNPEDLGLPSFQQLVGKWSFYTSTGHTNRRAHGEIAMNMDETSRSLSFAGAMMTDVPGQDQLRPFIKSLVCDYDLHSRCIYAVYKVTFNQGESGVVTQECIVEGFVDGLEVGGLLRIVGKWRATKGGRDADHGEVIMIKRFTSEG